jgi:hypothetical protein
MIGRNIRLKMSYNTIQKIYSISSGVVSNEYKIVDKLNDLKYDIVEMPDDEVILECNYIPTSWESMKFELYK